MFEGLNAEIVSIAQLETDPAMLPRIKEFVHNSFPIVADPDQVTRELFDIFGVYLIDKKGILQTFLPGTKEARPRLDILLEELAKLEGVDPPLVEDASGHAVARMTNTYTPPARTLKAEDVLGIRWMWSHDKVAPKDRFKLAFVADIADGYHVYGSGEKRMKPFKIEFELPEGITLRKQFGYPKAESKMDPILKVELEAYDKVIAMPVIYFEVGEDASLGEYPITATVHYQACNESVCHPPFSKEITLPLQVVAADVEREGVAGHEMW